MNVKNAETVKNRDRIILDKYLPRSKRVRICLLYTSVDCRLLDTLMYCADYLEIPRDRVHVISHTEGFIYRCV